MATCHICNASSLSVIDEVSTLRMVTSDCRPWTAPASTAVCQACGNLVRVVDEGWLGEIDEIYGSYVMLYQSSAADQTIFDADEASQSRTVKLADLINRHCELRDGMSVLDIGSGTGAMLFALADCASLDLWANDLTSRFIDRLETVPGFCGLLEGTIDTIEQQFDLVTMVHVLEHIVDPVPFIDQLRKLLKPGGHIVIEVPDADTNPFDLTIFDHATHYTARHLGELLKSRGWRTNVLTNEWIGKELSCIARPEGSVEAGLSKQQPANGTEHARWLAALVERVRSLDNATEVIILGASISGTWLASSIPDWCGAFVEDDPSKWGREVIGRPIVSPTDLPADASLVIPLVPQVAARVAARFSDKVAAVITPPDLPRA